MMQEPPPRAWVETDVEAIAHNLAVVRSAADNMMQMPVVKANAYGHGLEPVARRLDAEDVAFFGVANVHEARRLQKAGVRTRPFILGPTLPDEREEVVLNDWGCTISTLAEAEHLHSLAALHGRVFAAQMALETGMGREGFLPAELGQVVPQLAALSHLRVEGIMSHFSAADEDGAYTRAQAALFDAYASEVAQHLPLRYRHIAASAGHLGPYAATCANLARPGIVLYGVSPLDCPRADRLRPALRLLSRVVLVRELPAGQGVSYGHTYTTSAPTRVATIGIGYADGWPRHLSGRGAYVCIAGQRCPVLGRVTMDLLIVDAGAVPHVAVGDEVELIGPHLPVQQVAEWAGTIPWEIFTGLGVRLPRLCKAE